MRVVCISDTHERHEHIQMPAGDILIHAGDFTFRGEQKAVQKFNEWLGRQPFKHKIVIAGNHELTFERQREQYEPMLTNCEYLLDREITVEGLRIYGSPWTPEFFDWAFMKKRGAELEAVWSRVPEDLDILLTHGPPMGVGDQLQSGVNVGDEELRKAIEAKRPRFNVSGHIHCGYGTRVLGTTACINAAICDEDYHPTQSPIVIDL